MRRVVQDVKARVSVISFVLFITLADADIFVHAHNASWLLRLLEATPSVGSLMNLLLGLLVFQLNGFDGPLLRRLIVEVSLRLILLHILLLKNRVVLLL